MNGNPELIIGEYRRSLDDRSRLSVPGELADVLTSRGTELVLAKERPGSLSLWTGADWAARVESGVGVVQQKLAAGRLSGRIERVQLLGRLLSTRHRPVQLAGRGRLLIPEGFREFLGVDAGGDPVLLGAHLLVLTPEPLDLKVMA